MKHLSTTSSSNQASLGCSSVVSDLPADEDGLPHGLGIECSAIATSMVHTQLL